MRIYEITDENLFLMSLLVLNNKIEKDLETTELKYELVKDSSNLLKYNLLEEDINPAILEINNFINLSKQYLDINDIELKDLLNRLTLTLQKFKSIKNEITRKT